MSGFGECVAAGGEPGRGEIRGGAETALVLGGALVEAALSRYSGGAAFDAICETDLGLPEAVVLRTPCRVGNGRLRVLTLERWALTLFEPASGVGLRVAVKARGLASWPALREWLTRPETRQEQDGRLVQAEICEAGSRLYLVASVRVRAMDTDREERRVVECPLCGELYPRAHGPLCRGCRGEAPYESAFVGPDGGLIRPSLAALPLERAVGQAALHDMTCVAPGESKVAAFRRGQVIGAGDIGRLERMGRQSLFLVGSEPSRTEWIHEDQAAKDFAAAMAGAGVQAAGEPREGKVTLRAARPGLLLVDVARLEAFNLLPGVMCASRRNARVVTKETAVAATRAIPLYLPRAVHAAALRLLAEAPLFRVLPLRQLDVGVLVTGTEVYQGLVEDSFAPVIRAKVEAYGCRVIDVRIAPDDRQAIVEGFAALLAAGAQLVVVTGGLSVDPDDNTRQAMADAGVRDMLHGLPLLPGAMTLLGRVGDVRVIGVPACGLYFKITAFDVLLPRLLADAPLTRADLAPLGHGGLCLERP